MTVKILPLFCITMIISSAFAQPRFGNDELYLEQDASGIFQLKGTQKRDILAHPLENYDRQAKIMGEVYDWIMETHTHVKGIEFNQDGLEITAGIQPNLTLPHVPLSILSTDLIPSQEFRERQLEDYERIKLGLLGRGMNEVDFESLEKAVNGQFNLSQFDSHHPLRKELFATYDALMAQSSVSPADVEEYIQMEHIYLTRSISEDWGKKVLSQLSPQGRRVLISFLFEDIVEKGALVFLIQTRHVSNATLERRYQHYQKN